VKVVVSIGRDSTVVTKAVAVAVDICTSGLPACVDVTLVWSAYSLNLCSDYAKQLPVIVVIDVSAYPRATSVVVTVA
jgi:hypothetical protein